jgi:hypothetical protein
MKSLTYDVYSVAYNEQGERSFESLGEYGVPETEEIIFLIIENYLSPEDIAFVESVKTKTGINVINKKSHALLFRFDKIS